MSKEALAKVVGRALLDRDFAARLAKDPEAAAKSISAKLTKAEISALSDVSATHMKAVSNLLKKQLGTKAIFDQQQQQQARMD